MLVWAQLELDSDRERDQNLGSFADWPWGTAEHDRKHRHSYTLARVELPRLHLHFRIECPGSVPSATGARAREGRLWCEECPGYWLCSLREEDKAARSLLNGLPHSLLLRNAEGEMQIILPATSMPSALWRR